MPKKKYRTITLMEVKNRLLRKIQVRWEKGEKATEQSEQIENNKFKVIVALKSNISVTINARN